MQHSVAHDSAEAVQRGPGTSEPSVKTQLCRHRRLLSPIRANVNAVSPSPAIGTDYPALEVHDFRRRRIAPHFDKCRVSACIVKAGGDEFLHTKLPHVAERHRWAGWMFRLGHTGRVAGLASPGQATICNYTSVSVAYANLRATSSPAIQLSTVLPSLPAAKVTAARHVDRTS